MNDNTKTMPISAAKLTRYEFDRSVFAVKSEKGVGFDIHVYDKMIVFAPESEPAKIEAVKPEYLPQLSEAASELGEWDESAVKVTFSHAFIFDGNRPTAFKELLLFAKDGSKVKSEPERMIPVEIANAVFGGGYEFDAEDASLTREELLQTVAMGLDILRANAEAGELTGETLKDVARRKFGPDTLVMEEGDSDEYVKVSSAIFTGLIGVAAPTIGDDGKQVGTTLRTYSKMRVFFEPGREPVVKGMPSKAADDFTELSNGTFTPSRAMLFERAAMIDAINDDNGVSGGMGLALGNIKIMVADGTTIEWGSGWVPKTPFTIPSINYQTFLDTRPSPPSIDEMRATDAEIDRVETVGVTFN